MCPILGTSVSDLMSAGKPAPEAQEPKAHRSGLILAGGRSTRFGGGDKAIKPVDGQPMICRARDALKASGVDEIIVSVRDEAQRALQAPVLHEHLPFVVDELHEIGPMAGLLAGLSAAHGEYVVVVACDMPFISPEIIFLLLQAAEGHDAAVPVREKGYVEPLHAVYRREPAIAAIKKATGAGNSRVAAVLHYLVDVVYVPVESLRKIDPELRTFANINRAEDLPP